MEGIKLTITEKPKPVELGNYRERVDSKINSVVSKYNLNVERFRTTLFKESGLNHYREDLYNKPQLEAKTLKINPTGHIGIAQFNPRTFKGNQGYMNRPDLDVNNVFDQIEVMGYMWSKNQQCQWEAYGRTYGGCNY